MTTHTTKQDGARSDEEERSRLVDSISKSLDEWRGRIDELAVQADLAKLDLRELTGKQLDIAQNACLAVHSKLAEARRDAGVSAEALRQGVDQVLRDLQGAFNAAEDVIARGRAG